MRRRRSQGTVGRVRPRARPVGRLAVGVREPPCPNLVGWTALAGSLSASGGSGEITLATALRDGRVPSHGSATAPGREAAPEKHRGKHPGKPPTISHAPPSPSSEVAGLPSGLSAGSAVLVRNASCRPAVTTVAPSKRCEMKLIPASSARWMIRHPVDQVQGHRDPDAAAGASAGELQQHDLVDAAAEVAGREQAADQGVERPHQLADGLDIPTGWIQAVVGPYRGVVEGAGDVLVGWPRSSSEIA
jgi:hypothetical protein